jgi:hypothetical protein
MAIGIFLSLQRIGVRTYLKGIFTSQGDASLFSITQTPGFLKYLGQHTANRNQSGGKVALR